MKNAERDRPAPHGRDPGEDLHARRHRDDHGRRGKVGPRVNIQPHCVHVVRPDDEADEANREHRIGHAQIAEDRLAGEGRHHVADNAESRQDHDVDFRMSEEPEQVQEQDRIAAAGRIEEGRTEVTVRQQHGDGTGQNRKRQQQQEGGDQHGPDKQRHLVQRHARGTHVEDRGDEVTGAKDRGGTGKMQGQNRHVHGGTRRSELARHRRIDRPAHTGPAVREGRHQQQCKSRNQQPEADVVHTREGHIRRADHQRHEPVAKPPIRPGMTMKNTMIRPCAVVKTFQTWPFSMNWTPGS
mgnify:CR=1 FL=1